MTYRKYRNRKASAFGIQFDSEAERARYYVLREQEELGFIRNLECHPAFVLLEGFKDCTGKREQAIKYTADFSYTTEGRQVVEEIKSKATAAARDWSLRRKIFKHRYPDIELKVVMI